MQIQVQDFPSDNLGETYNVRAELTKCLQRSCVSESGAAIFREIMKFSISKLKEADAERNANQPVAVVEEVVTE